MTYCPIIVPWFMGVTNLWGERCFAEQCWALETRWLRANPNTQKILTGKREDEWFRQVSVNRTVMLGRMV